MWAYETTFYQIYPLGFCGAPRENVAPVAEDELSQAAGTAPNPDAPIMKIAQWADYMQELGVGAVLINPPLESDSHGYDTRSLRHLDRRLGALLAKARADAHYDPPPRAPASVATSTVSGMEPPPGSGISASVNVVPLMVRST